MTRTTTAAKTTTKKTTSTSKPTAAKTSTKKTTALPKGYVIRWPHGGYDLAKRGETSDQTGPRWLIICNAHATTYAVDSASEGDKLGSSKGRKTWCTKCRSAATK